MAETEVEESRGSFLVKDGEVHLVCNHQTVQDIKLVNRLEDYLEAQSPSGYPGFDLEKGTQFPVLIISGWVFSMNTKTKSGVHEKSFDFDPKGPTICAKYWVLFDQKNDSQIGFQVKFGEPNFEFQSRPQNVYGRYRGFRRRLSRKRRLGFYWSFSRPRKIVMASSSEEEMEEIKGKETKELNRIFFTYSSERSERFYGFGEQFSFMDFKGKRVPILVQEQGIGRGDQPITFAANLVSYR